MQVGQPLRAVGALLTAPLRETSVSGKVQQWGAVLLLLAAAAVAASIAVGTLPKIGSTIHAAPMLPGYHAFNDAVLVIHILTAIPPLLLGFYAFSRDSRRSGARGHRVIGTGYCVAIWISAVTGLMLAVANPHGMWAKLGFGTLAVVWFTTTTFAYVSARRKDFAAHRVWMIRSFAVTLAVVSIRPMGLFGPLLPGFTVDEWYVLLTWMCWVPNLMVGEFYARITTPAGRLRIWRKSTAATRPIAA